MSKNIGEVMGKNKMYVYEKMLFRRVKSLMLFVFFKSGFYKGVF